MRCLPLLVCLAVFSWAVTAAADTVIVDIDGIHSDFTHIQDGLDAVSDGGTVYVFPGRSGRGVYSGPRNRNLQFGGKNIALETFAAGPGDVVIDCGGLDRAFNLSVGVDSTSHISGFTIANGIAGENGGAIRAAGACPVIVSCIFRNNRATDGGAVWAAEGPLRVRSCDFYGNTATGDGGAMYMVSSDVVIRNCLFYQNEAGSHGAMAVTGDAPLISKCSFAANGGDDAGCVGIDGTGGLVEQCILAFGVLGPPVDAPSPEIVHCCVFGNASGDALPGNVHDCMEGVDPRMCGLETGDLSLCSNSNCLPVNNIWYVQVGARAQGCGECESPAEASSWGSVKALFR
jgi:hypothetical protein